MTINQIENEGELSWGPINAQVVKKFVEHEEERFRISPQRTLQSLIPEKSKLKIVMYVQRVDFILELFQDKEIENAIVIIGDSVVTKNRSSSDPETFLKLAKLLKDGVLRVRVPKKGIFHEKWILAENEDGFSDIFGTANLTSKGSGRTGGQSNQVRVNKITGYFADSARYKKLNDEFNEWYFEKSEPYLDELVNLL